jgi:uncharacterized membrane-anchored protein YhcB (DUF1043 family)
MFATILAYLTPEVVSLLAALLAGVVGAVIKSFWSAKATKYESNFLLGTQIAFLAVNEISKRTANPVDDKIALGLQLLKEHLSKSGQKLVPADEARAKELFSAMHGDAVEVK